MNRQITQLFAVFVALFALLVAFTSRWTVFEAESLEENSANRRPLLEEQQVPRGQIFAEDGRTVIARSQKQGSGQRERYVREYPLGNLFSHPIGYSFVEYGRAGLERSHNEQLAGERGEFESIADELFGAEREGFDVTTTLDVDAQRLALEQLGGRRGSVVAIEPQTGRVRVLANVPNFDPNTVPDRDSEPNFLSLATQARFAPGSTMKVVTAVAALDTGEFTPDSILDGGSPKTISGAPLANFGGQDFGPVTLTDALTNSVNTVWAQVGEQLGKGEMLEYMDRFGFNSKPPIDLPRDELSTSGVFDSEKQEFLDEDDPIDVGRVAIGQERLAVTPLQMAMVPAAVANDGKLMEPQLVEEVRHPDGRLEEEFEPNEEEEVMSARTAGGVAQMMSRVVEEGSGTAAALEGIDVAGKTGTAEIPGQDCPGKVEQNQAWFIAFAPVDDPQVAIAVTIECAGGGTGGETAAPVARAVMQELLR